MRQTALLARPFLSNKQIIVAVAKGIEEGSLLTTSEIIHDVLKTKTYLWLHFQGPTHAESGD